MPISKEEFINELNKDLEWEYAAAIQYIQHAAVITGPEYDAISKELTVHANEEIGHAQKVAVMIADLGGIPVIDVEERKIAEDAKAMLEQDLEGEELAVSRYKERVAQAEELKEYGIRRVLEDILMDEEEHRRDILSSLGR
ncbi:bacterioferritin [Pseudomonadota bacterium]